MTMIGHMKKRTTIDVDTIATQLHNILKSYLKSVLLLRKSLKF
jgi:hypothetical protein